MQTKRKAIVNVCANPTLASACGQSLQGVSPAVVTRRGKGVHHPKLLPVAPAKPLVEVRVERGRTVGKQNVVSVRAVQGKNGSRSHSDKL